MAVCRSIFTTEASELREIITSIVLDKNHPIHVNSKKAQILATKAYGGIKTASGKFVYY